ncbi:MAG: thiamine diphosphokinase [Microthrixaceae bacterium]
MATTVVFGGGPTPAEQIRAALDGVDVGRVICADSGLEGALSAGIHCDLVVGDMDSVSPAAIEEARRSGSAVEHHSTDKALTDLELALQRAVPGAGEGAAVRPGDTDVTGADVLVIGSDGGRLDHLAASIALVGSPLFAAASITAVFGATTIAPVHSSRSLGLAPDATVTVLALHGAVRGLTLRGARWPLADAELHPGSTHGVSNQVVGPTFEVSVSSGVATVVVPPPGTAHAHPATKTVTGENLAGETVKEETDNG